MEGITKYSREFDSFSEDYALVRSVAVSNME